MKKRILIFKIDAMVGKECLEEKIKLLNAQAEKGIVVIDNTYKYEVVEVDTVKEMS